MNNVSELRGRDRYAPLCELLSSAPAGDVVLTLDEIQRVVGFELPDRARRDPGWWRPAPRNTWARAWLRADRLAALDIAAGTVTFAEGHHDGPDPAWSYAQRRREEEHAREALHDGPRGAAGGTRWWEPHRVYVVHEVAEGLYKVGLTRHDTHRIRDLTARGRGVLAASLLLPNRWAARLVEIAVLDATERARRQADRFTHLNGQTEHWADTTPAPDLVAIATELERDDSLTWWTHSAPGSAELASPVTPLPTSIAAALEGTEAWLSTEPQLRMD